MLNIDTTTMRISITRRDTASIVFSAIKADGDPYDAQAGDILKFAVAKKVGATPLFEIVNEMENDEDAFWTIVIDDNAWDDAQTNNGGTDIKFGDYVYDVQLTNSVGTETIIGKTDEITPTFRVWGEVATE